MTSSLPLPLPLPLTRQGEGADLEGHDYLRGIEACVVIVELARLAQVREELACRRGRKQR